MARSLHVRLDDESAAALEIVRHGELSDSEAVRLALREAAAWAVSDLGLRWCPDSPKSKQRSQP